MNGAGRITPDDLQIDLTAFDDQAAASGLARREAAEAERRRVADFEYTAEHLRARADFTLENFRRDVAASCWIDGAPATLDNAIAAILAGKSALIVGPTRGGKSHLAVAIARETGKPAMRIKDFELATLFDVNRFRSENNYKKMIDNAVSCGILVYDDAGKNACANGANTTAYGNVIFGIFDARIEHGRQTIVTSRIMDGQTLKAQLGEDLLYRMELRDPKGPHHVFIVFGSK